MSQWSLTFEVRKRGAELPQLLFIEESQWSLTFEVRKRGPVLPPQSDDGEVAMEPDL